MTPRDATLLVISTNFVLLLLRADTVLNIFTKQFVFLYYYYWKYIFACTLEVPHRSYSQYSQ